MDVKQRGVRLSGQMGTHFHPDEYLLGVVQSLGVSRRSARIKIEGNGEVVVLGKRKAFIPMVTNMAEFCSAPSNRFTVAPLVHGEDSALSGAVRDLEELLWECTFHASSGRLVKGLTDCDVVQFTGWPNLTRLSYTPNTMRAFALLVKVPTAIVVAQRQILRISAEEMHQIYSAAYAAGLAKIINRHPSEKPGVEVLADEPLDAADTADPHRSVFSRLVERISHL